MRSNYAYDDGLFHITEIFDSIDGEGKRTGFMAVFLRLAGCNLRCNYCDTAYSLTLEDTAEALTEEEVIRRIHGYPWKRLTITMDFKCSGSGMKSRMNPDNFKLLNGGDVLKFVVSSKEDLDEMKDVVKPHFTAARHPQFFVSPVWGRIQPDKLVDYVRNHQLQDVRVQVQLHKIIWDPDRRGV